MLIKFKFYSFFIMVFSTILFARDYEVWNIKNSFTDTMTSNKYTTTPFLFERDNFNLYAELECGYYSNRSLYASFGYETQIFTCKELTIGTSYKFQKDWIFKGEFSPVYYGIKNQQVSPNNIKVYDSILSPNGDSFEVDGGIRYIDWYKNLGNRPYNIGNDFPFKELYIKWVIDSYNITFGRQINKLSFNKDEIIWKEDMWFSPMSYWFSKDLEQGINFNYNNHLLDFNFAIFSGDGNTAKNHFYYLGNEGDSNLKSNNTPTLSTNISFDYVYGRVFFGWEQSRVGSTYNISINEGKHTREILVAGGILKLHNFNIFGQYTVFKSGLNPKSAQNRSGVCLDINDNNINCFKIIEQKGFFVGFDYTIDRWKFGFVYEAFDRYDFNALMYDKKFDNNGGDCTGGACFGNRSSLDSYMGSLQKSYIFQVVYSLNDNLYLDFAYHKIKNPLNWISHILPSRGEDKMKLTFRLKI